MEVGERKRPLCSFHIAFSPLFTPSFTSLYQFEIFVVLVLLSMLVENTVCAASEGPTALYIRSLRIIFLVDSLNILKRLIRNTLSSLIALREVLMLGASMITFFALTAIIVWPPLTTAEGATHFYTIHRSIMTFTFASMGAVNFPDIMLPAVNEDYRATCIFFILFMVIVVVWLLNLCLATVFQQYRSFVHKRWLQRYETRRNALLCAFILLDVDGNGRIEKQDFVDAVTVVKNLDKEDVHECDYLWKHCDVDGDGVLDGGDFFHICDVLVCNVKERVVSREHIVPSPYVRERSEWTGRDARREMRDARRQRPKHATNRSKLATSGAFRRSSLATA